MYTWDDVRERARFDPYLQYAVTLADRGDCTREEALIAAVLAMSQVMESLRKQVVEAKMHETHSPFSSATPKG